MIFNSIILIICSTTALVSSSTIPSNLGLKSIVPVKEIAITSNNPTSNGNVNSPVLKSAIKNSPMFLALNKLSKSSATKPVVKAASQPVAQVQKPVTNQISNVKGSSSGINAAISSNVNSKTSKFKPFRVLGQAVKGFQHANGTFNHEAYSLGMNALSKSQKYRESRIPRPKSKILRRRSTNTTIDNISIVVFDTNVTYDTALVTEFKVGTPPQTIPFVVNLEMPESVLWKKSDTCPSGYDLDASQTVTELSSDIYTGDIALEGLLESIEEVTITGTLIRDFVTFESYPSEDHVRAVAATFVWATTTAAAQVCLAQVGLGAFFYSDPNLWSLPEFAIGFGAGTIFSLFITAVYPPELPLQYQAEIMIGGSERSKYTGKMYQIGVSKAVGKYTNYPWKLEFGPMRVNGVRLAIPVGTVSFSLVHVGIHLPKASVEAIYAVIGKFKTYSLTPGGPLIYTYLCKLSPKVGFTIPKTNIAFTVDPSDFNQGFHPTEPAYCIGAVQLANDPDNGPVHTLGLVFYKSWYTVFEKNADGTSKSIRIARAATHQV